MTAVVCLTLCGLLADPHWLPAMPRALVVSGLRKSGIRGQGINTQQYPDQPQSGAEEYRHPLTDTSTLIILEGWSLLQSIPPTTSHKPTKTQRTHWLAGGTHVHQLRVAAMCVCARFCGPQTRSLTAVSCRSRFV